MKRLTDVVRQVLEDHEDRHNRPIHAKEALTVTLVEAVEEFLENKAEENFQRALRSAEVILPQKH